MKNATEMNWLERLTAWRRGGWAGPVRIVLFPTNRCNLRCRICWQRDFTVDRGELSEERLLRLVDECAESGVQEWLIVGGGEPMVRGDTVVNLAGRIRERGMNGSIQTNAVLLRDRHIQALIDFKWATVMVSLDGPDQATNDTIRSPGSFKGAIAAMRRLTQLKGEQGAALPKLSLNVTLTRLNVDRLDHLFRLAQEVGGDGDVIFSSLIVTGKETEALAFSEEDRGRLGRYAREVGERPWPYAFGSNLVNEFSSLDAPRSGWGKTGFKKGDLGGARCYEPWLSMTVMPDGRVGPCCVMWAPDLDSLADKSLQEVWRGPYLEKVRGLMSEGGAPDYCVNCPSGLTAAASQQRQALWEHIRWNEGGVIQRAALLAGKTFGSAHRHGIRHVLRRGREWLRIQRNLRRP